MITNIEDPKKTQSLANKLLSTNNEIILEGLTESRKLGAPQIIPLIIDLLISTKNETIYEKASTILFDLKLQESTEYVIQAAKSKKTKGHKNILISALWQSSLDATEYIKDLVAIAISEDYLTALECLTVIENFEGPFQNTVLEECLVALSERHNQDNDKEELLQSMVAVIEGFTI